MIGSLTGNVVHKTDKYCILDVGGVGYKVFCTLDTSEYASASENVFLFISTIVREDVFELYGFRDEHSLDMFEKLIGVSGIGPRSALGVLALAPINNLQNAIASGDITYLTKVSGIGKKTAEKILIELKDIMAKNNLQNNTVASDDSEILEALESLGYSTQESRAALNLISKETLGINNKIKEALKYISK